MRITWTILLVFLFLFPRTLHSQETIQYKKLYLHTDREYYFLGDSVWFKAYYLDGQDHHFIYGHYSMYVDIVDSIARTISNRVFPIVNGVAIGKIDIPDSLEPGNYLLRAFTDFQRIIGEEAFFYKTLEVSSITSRNEQADANERYEEPKIDVAFLPEGGFLLAGQSNVMGVKAIDETGRGIPVSGRILNSDGEVVSTFSTKYRGMGSIPFKPQKNETYVADIEGYPALKYEFSDIVKEGVKLEYVGESRYELLFRGTTNSKKFLGEEFVFVIMHRGRVILQQQFAQDGRMIPIKVNRSVLPGGINRFVLLDNQLKPISERLVFIRNNKVNNMEINCDRDGYETRSSVQIDILDDMEIRGEAISSLSIAAVDEKSVGENGPAMNIQSWLLVDSELKGNIETPSDYFLDDDSLSSEGKLNLLMLTHGWSKYIWNAVPEKELPLDFIETEGFSINGSVTGNYFNSPVASGRVHLTIFNDEYLFTSETRTDRNGLFSFDSIYFSDSASVYLQAWNEKGKSFKTVSINPFFRDIPIVSKTYHPTIEVTPGIPKELQRQKYYNDMSLREYIMKSGSFFIEEVEVVAKKGDGHNRKMYSQPSSSLKVTMADYAYTDVFDYLRGRVPGLTVRYTNGEFGLEKIISIRGGGTINGSTAVLFLLNGMPVSKEAIQNLPMSEIDVVDVLKSVGETAIFGIRGANGVVAVYTKMGLSDEEYNTYSPGTISKNICGYSAYKDFYSPAYSTEIDTEMPDHRITLYWNPNIITENGKATVSFFTSDDRSRYKVFVEGITNTGEICLGSADFDVN